MTAVVRCAPADALFASVLQVSDDPGPEQVKEAIAATLARLGPGGCAACVAREFGEHPETAVPRMRWACSCCGQLPGGPRGT